MIPIYILVNHGIHWHVCQKRAGRDPVYRVIASSKYESSAREILAALIFQNQPSKE